MEKNNPPPKDMKSSASQTSWILYECKEETDAEMLQDNSVTNDKPEDNVEPKDQDTKIIENHNEQGYRTNVNPIEQEDINMNTEQKELENVKPGNQEKDENDTNPEEKDENNVNPEKEDEHKVNSSENNESNMNSKHQEDKNYMNPEGKDTKITNHKELKDGSYIEIKQRQRKY